MKLKNLLLLAFLTLTLIPVIIVSLLLYKSGFELSKESYTINLAESLTVQEDYIAQTLEHDMIADSRFARRMHTLHSETPDTPTIRKEGLLTAFQAYLEGSEDRIALCMLLDADKKPIYAIGENDMLQSVIAQLPALDGLKNQNVVEFELGEDGQSLGIITPLFRDDGSHGGSFVSVYNKYTIFKIISSYYRLVDTATFLCRANGEIINHRKLHDRHGDDQHSAAEKVLVTQPLVDAAVIDARAGSVPVLGYSKKIQKTPWYLVGFVDVRLIYAFTNRFVWVYLMIVAGVLLADILLAVYVSRKVVEPINGLIRIMEGYKSRLDDTGPPSGLTTGYVEIRYLWTKFFELMRTIMRVQHNFAGVYQLYQSGATGDINVDIDVKRQSIQSDKACFQQILDAVELPQGLCIVERFVRCFAESDQALVMALFETMRDEHLSVAREAELFTPHMGQKWFHALIVPMYEDDRLSRLFVQLRDISGFKKQEFESIEQAQRDPLTGLYNRAGFTARVNKALQEGTAQSHGLLFIDMDFFKLVNDNFGHSAGDELLRSVGEVLENMVQSGFGLADSEGREGVASRFGGDEFAVFVPNASLAQIESVRAQLAERLVYPFTGDALSFVVSASIGVAEWLSASPVNLEGLLHEADANMYQVKKTLKNGRR